MEERSLLRVCAGPSKISQVRLVATNYVNELGRRERELPTGPRKSLRYDEGYGEHLPFTTNTPRAVRGILKQL